MIRIQEQVMYDKLRTNIIPNVEKQSNSSIIRNKTRCPVSLLFFRVLFILVKAIRQEKERQADTQEGRESNYACRGRRIEKCTPATAAHT